MRLICGHNNVTFIQMVVCTSYLHLNASARTIRGRLWSRCARAYGEQREAPRERVGVRATESSLSCAGEEGRRERGSAGEGCVADVLQRVRCVVWVVGGVPGWFFACSYLFGGCFSILFVGGGF